MINCFFSLYFEGLEAFYGEIDRPLLVIYHFNKL